MVSIIKMLMLMLMMTMMMMIDNFDNLWLKGKVWESSQWAWLQSHQEAKPGKNHQFYNAMCNGAMVQWCNVQWYFATMVFCYKIATSYCYMTFLHRKYTLYRQNHCICVSYVPLCHCTATLMSSGDKTINTGYISLIFLPIELFVVKSTICYILQWITT